MTDDEAVIVAARQYVRVWRRFTEHADDPGTRIEHAHAFDALLAAVERPCWICEDGMTLETDGVCDGCGRYGGCPRCADGDCSHLQGHDAS